MASRPVSSNGLDWEDVMSAWKNYEAFNDQVITVSIQRGGSSGKPDLIVTAKAEKGHPLSGAPLSVSASVSTRQAGYVQMESVLMKVLYDLDVATYQEENSLSRTNKKA